MMEQSCNFAEENLPLPSKDGALEEAKNSCTKLLRYRFARHVKEVNETKESMKLWRLVLLDSVDKESKTTDSCAILCSGCGDITEEVTDKVKNSESQFSYDLALIKLPKETNDICYVLCNNGERKSVMDSTSVKELECHGEILCISNGQDPPEAISSEIIKSYFGDYKKPCSNLDKSYVDIVRNGDVQKLKEISDVADIKCGIDKNGWTLLHHAVYYGNFEILQFLFSIGCDGHARDNICGRKPVIIAAREGHTEIIKYFFDQDHSLNVDEVDDIGWTLLHYAAWNGDLESVRFLIQKKARVDVKDKCVGKTPAHVAAEEGHLDVVELLLRSGSSTEEKTNEKDTPLHMAACNGFLDIVACLVERKANLNAEVGKGWTPLCYAAFEGHLSIVQFLVNEGVNIDGVWGMSPLHCAAMQGHLKIVELLVNQGANVNGDETITGCMPLTFAAGKGYVEIVKFLFNRGANFNGSDVFRWITHVESECGGHLEIIDYLIGTGANINVSASQLRHRWTAPLQRAARVGALKIVEFLVARGADINGRNLFDWTALDCAANRGHLEVVEFLVGKGADVNAADEDGWTPLHFAADRGYLKIVDFLVGNGANLDAVTEEGKTALVCGVKNVEVASYLASKMLTIFQNQDKFVDAMKFFKDFLELQWESLGFVPPETLAIQKKIEKFMYEKAQMLYYLSQYSDALSILDNVPRSESDSFSHNFFTLRFNCELGLLMIEDKINAYDLTSAISVIQDAYFSTKQRSETREDVALIIEEFKTMNEVEEDLNEISSSIVNSKNNTTQTEPAVCKQCFKYENCVFLLLFAVICQYLISCFQQ